MSKNNDALKFFLTVVKKKGLKLTKQRKAIATVFFSHKGHHSAEEILDFAKNHDSSISLATVYRTLNMLIEHNLANAHHFQNGMQVFEPTIEPDEHHDHLICQSCNLIVEFFNKEVENLQDKIAKEHGFIIKDHKMELYGLCNQCR